MRTVIFVGLLFIAAQIRHLAKMEPPKDFKFLAFILAFATIADILELLKKLEK